MWILVLFTLFIVAIGISYYFDYLNDKKYLNKKLLIVLLTILCFLIIMFYLYIISI